MIRFSAMVFGVVAVVALSAQGQDDGQVYRIKNKFTDKLLVPDDAGTGLIQRSAKGKDKAAQWQLVKSKTGNFFQIVNVASGKVITAPSKEAGAQVALGDNGGDKAKVGQLWSFEKRDKKFAIQSRLSGFYLDVANADPADGVKIIQFELNEKGNRGNQIWELIPAK